MDYTFGDALERLKGIARGQTEGYRRLLASTRESTEALSRHDAESFDRVLAEQVEILRDLENLERERRKTLHEVGPPRSDEAFDSLERELKHLAGEVTRANRKNRLVVERNGALVEARLGLHRRVGTVSAKPASRLDERA